MVELRVPFVSEFRVYGTKDDFDSAVIAATGSPADTKIPSTWAATVTKRIVHCVSLPVFLKTHPGENQRSDEDLLVHELAHQLHVDLLQGDEDHMGPMWFFEGLAVVAAAQYAASPFPSNERVREILSSNQRGDYREYGAMVRRLVSSTPVAALVNKARQDDFNRWAETTLTGLTEKRAE